MAQSDAELARGEVVGAEELAESMVARRRRPSCSASQPAVVAGMLEALDIQPGARVLEIGTGTGYNAALLAELVGPRGHVLTVEVDGGLASAARRNIAAAGYQDRVEVLAADGAMTLAAAGSVDRVIATAAVQLGRLPYPWIEQTRLGGFILAPVRAELASGRLVRLRVGSEGTARGQAVRMRVGFMELRAQRTLGASFSALRWDDPDVAPSLTEVDPFTALLSEAPRWAIAVSVPSCRYGLEERTNERRHGVAWLLDPITGSWASVVPTTPRSQHYLTRQAGPRRLWDEAATAYRWWDQHGQPPIKAWHWTITPTGNGSASPNTVARTKSSMARPGLPTGELAYSTVASSCVITRCVTTRAGQTVELRRGHQLIIECARWRAGC